jgi:NADH-quinone oxidoreductase subunit C
MISAVDWKDRFEVVYHISSYRYNLLVQMTAQIPRDDPQVDSVAKIWGGANWHEREAWDLMGIKFIDHPDLRRVLLPDDWVGHPLRKDYKEGE